MWPTRDIVTAFCNFFFYCIMLMQSHIGHRGSRPITWVYKFKLGLLMGSRATKLVVGVHWFPLRLGITLLWLNLMICHSNYCFQAIVSYWGEALQGKTWLPTKISIYLSIVLKSILRRVNTVHFPTKIDWLLLYIIMFLNIVAECYFSLSMYRN